MGFIETVRRARDLVRQEGRITLRGLQRELGLDDPALEELIDELVDAQQVAGRQGKLVVWLGAARSGEGVASDQAPPVAGLEPEAEHRHLTVMFCDLVDSTELSRKLDAESLRNVIRSHQEAASDVIRSHGGHVAQVLGDGLLVYFGYPTAHEDDAEHAVRAGLEIVRSLGTSSAATSSPRLGVRVGIHTGRVVVGTMGGGSAREILAVSDTPNIAARVLGVADPDTVVISDATLRLVAGLFATEDRGAPRLKGIEEPIRVHRVLAPTGVRSRLDRAPELTPFVGREQELERLARRWEQAREGRGQGVLIGGEPGIGKSRLVHRFREQLGDTPHTWLECSASPYTTSSALRPLVELAERAFRLREADPPERRAERLARELQELGIAEAAPLLAGTLGLPVSERQAGVATSARERRRQTLNALVAWVLALGERQRVVLVVEDLHWADPSTLEWLGLLFEPCATARVLLLATYRPGFAPPWPDRGHVTGVTLERLAHGRARELAVAAAGGTLPETLIKQVATRSDGVPLFVEELAKDVVESHAQPCSPRTLLRIPATLEDSLMARLDRVGEAKQVAQLGATLGREFPYALIQAVSATDETRLRKGLERLVGAELLHQRGSPPSSVYAFKHALVQDAAYASLLESRRRALHGCIVDALHAHFPERVEREPEVAGHHCEAAGRSAEAIDHYQRAGKLAAESFAHAEASAHLERALGLLRRFPQAPERDEQEIELLLALAPSVSAAKGYAADELRQVFERARALCRGLGGHGSELFAAVFGLSNFHSIRGELQTSLELAEEALRLAEQAGNQRETQGAHARLGINLFGLSDLARAVEHLEQAIRLHDPAHTHPHDVFARSFLGSALLVLGLPDRARRTSHEAIELARGRDPSVLAMALGVDATLHYRLREPEATRKRAEEAIAIAEERGLPFPRALATTYRGWAVGGSEGLRDLRRGLAQFAELGAEERRPHAPLAEAYRDLGRTEEALAELEAALASRSEARTWDAELHRFKGEILLEQGEPEEGLRCLRRAHEISRRQGAQLLELRAVLSLARVLRAQGRPEEARALVQPVYHGFTEGFDTLDLKDAKALLEELA